MAWRDASQPFDRVSAAIIVAGGSGARFGGLKQFELLAGAPLLVHACRAACGTAEIATIVLVVPAGQIDRARDATRDLPRPCSVIAGGTSRAESVERGLAATDAQWVAVHDAARPLVSAALFAEALHAAHTTGAAICALPVRDTVKRAHSDDAGSPSVHATIPRADLWLAQTPQAFRRDLLQRAIEHAKARGDLAQATDDAWLIEQIGEPVQIVMGDAQNLKVTTPGDLVIAEALLRMRKV